jgi:hypothetical protein
MGVRAVSIHAPQSEPSECGACAASASVLLCLPAAASLANSYTHCSPSVSHAPLAYVATVDILAPAGMRRLYMRCIVKRRRAVFFLCRRTSDFANY